MKPIVVAATAILAIFGVGIGARQIIEHRAANQVGADGSVTLPNGWRITPAGRHVQLPGDLPMKIYATADGASIIVSTGGYHDHSLSVIDAKSAKIVSTINTVKTWDGMAVDGASGAVFLSGGGPGEKSFAATLGLTKEKMAADSNKPVLRVNFRSGALEPGSAVSIAGLDEKDRYISGITLGPGGALYVLNLESDTIYRLSGNGFSQQILGRTGYRPHSSVLSHDGKSLAVSYWGDQAVGILDAATLQEKARIAVGSHPNEMVWGADGRLFVANSGSNTVSVILGDRVVETIRTSIDAKALVGSTPDALALAPDGKRLYVANADNNNVAVIETPGIGKESHIAGFIPTGWYPTALAVSPDGRALYVGTGKGIGFRNNYPSESSQAPSKTPNPQTPYDYIGNVLSGALSIVSVPDATQLAAYTKQAIANVPVPADQVDAQQATLVEHDVFPKIKHVLYIIRENRTYDQVLGDLGKGNGDPKLVLFGEKVTPNAHSLARGFVTLDNLYCNGEVSEDGHEWSNAAYATDFNEKAWTHSYSKRGEPDADERLMDSPAGYLWDNAARHGETFRTYGEMASFVSTPEAAPKVKAEGSLKGHVSEAWLKEKGRDPEKAAVFIKELHDAEKTGSWPNFMVMSLGEDHTQGLTPNAFTPQARVGSNDQALGMIVEAVSRSAFWKDTAIFVIEDDAQNGPDHVDAHRTVGLVISPWVKRGAIDSTMYTTASMVRTMELILGLPPMTQFDSAATPMYFSFTTDAKADPIPNIAPATDLLSKNPATGSLARASMKLDFSDYDRADPDELNRILWAAIRPGETMPAPVRSARIR